MDFNLYIYLFRLRITFSDVFLKESLTLKNFREQYFVPLNRILGARIVHNRNMHQFFSAQLNFL